VYFGSVSHGGDRDVTLPFFWYRDLKK
jgi:hypothetical protein